jgi:hypothetical protein
LMEIVVTGAETRCKNEMKQRELVSQTEEQRTEEYGQLKQCVRGIRPEAGGASGRKRGRYEPAEVRGTAVVAGARETCPASFERRAAGCMADGIIGDDPGPDDGMAKVAREAENTGR